MGPKGKKKANMHCRKGIPFIVSLLFFSFLAGCLAQSVWGLTAEEEKRMGKRILLEIERNLEVIRDPSIQAYVDQIGQSIVREIGTTPFEFKFTLLKGNEANAFAVPGGYIFLTSGLFVLAENENEVAGVVSHEVAHVTGRHISQLIDRSKRLNIASLAAMIAGALLGGGKAGEALTATAMATSEAMTLKYTRDNETDADQNGLRFLVRAGYDPDGLITFLNKIYKTSLVSSSKIPAYLSTHPALEERIALMENLLLTAPKPQPPYRASGTFKRIQTRIFVEEREPHPAVAYFESLTRNNPQDVEALFGLGLALKKMGRPDKALEIFRSVEALVPGDLDCLREIGIVSFLSGKLDVSIEVLEKFRAFKQDDAAGNYYLAKGYQEKGRFDQALVLLTRIYKQMPDWAEVSLSLGSVYGRMGKKGLSHFYFGRHFSLRGDENAALRHFRTALDWLEWGSPEREQAQREIKERMPDRK
jgi:predicted Zn-dependent protease